MPSTSPSSDGQRAADPLEYYVAFFEGMTTADIDRVPDVYASDARFKDPFSDFRGHERLQRMFTAMLRDVRDYALVVDARCLDGQTGWLRWTMSGYVNALGKEKWIVTGTSVVVFDADGRVTEHIDYWDAASQMYERLPVLGWILGKIRGRFAAHSAAG